MNTKLIFKFLKKLPGKWLVPVIAIIWVLGVGMRLMSISTCLVLTIVLVAGWLVYLLIKWLLSKGKGQEAQEVPELAELDEKLTSVNKTAKNVPWYLVIGPSSSGKTSLLRNSDLDFSYIDSSQPVEEGISKTQNCDLFYTRPGIVLDTAGRYISMGKEAKVRTEWLGVLSLLKKHRKVRPIDGLVVAVDVTRLLQSNEGAVKEEARKIRERILEAVASLEITFPVYLMFTKCDVIYGFAQFFDGLTDAERSQVWGATLTGAQQADPQAAFREECDGLLQQLSDHRMTKLASAEGRSGSAIYAFPMEFDAACQKLGPFVDELFHIVSDEKPVFRGFYFTSSAQDDDPLMELVLGDVAKSIDCPPPAVPEQSSRDKGKVGAFFTKELFQRVIFPDKGLHSPTTEAERRRTFMSLGICGIAVLALAILTIVFAVSYVRNKRLISRTEGAAVAVNRLDTNAQPVEKLERFEALRKPIVKLERFTLFGLPWRGPRNDVAHNARKLYLTRKYSSASGAQERLSRSVEIDLKAYKSEAGKLEPIEKADIKTVVNGREYKTLSTNKEGTAALKMNIEDGKVSVAFSTDYELTGYEVQREQIYEIQPGERKGAKRIQFIFSKSGRVVIVHCTDQFGKDLPGVPVSVLIENADESKNPPSVQSNEKGIAQINLEAPENSALLIYYGDSPTSYSAGQPDSMAIQAGKTRYSLERQLRRKLDISVIAIAKSASDPTGQAKSGVTVSVGNTKLGLTDNNGYWTGPGDTVPTSQNVSAMPRPDSITVDTTASGYSIKLEYVLSEKPVEIVAPPEVNPEPLPVIKLDKSVPADVEVWMYIEPGDDGVFSSADEICRMEFKSEGNVIRLVWLKEAASKEGGLELPREAENHQLQLYHPDYWPKRVSWAETAQPIQMSDIKQEYSRKDFTRTQKDGAEYYYEHGEKYRKETNYVQAIRDFQNAIRLAPRLYYYLHLAWAYYESDQADAALRQVKTGLELKLTDDPETDEQLFKQQMQELLNMLE